MFFKSGVIGALGIASHVKVIHREDVHAEMSPPRSDSNRQIILKDFSGLLMINLVVIADTDDAVATMTIIERPTLAESDDNNNDKEGEEEVTVEQGKSKKNRKKTTSWTPIECDGAMSAFRIIPHVKAIDHENGRAKKSTPRSGSSHGQIVLETFTGVLTIKIMVVMDPDDVPAMTIFERPTLMESEDNEVTKQGKRRKNSGKKTSAVTPIESTLDKSKDEVSIVGRNVDSEPANPDGNDMSNSDSEDDNNKEEVTDYYDKMKRAKLWAVYKERFGKQPQKLRMRDIVQVLCKDDLDNEKENHTANNIASCPTTVN
ncbi:unnamed protein product [Cylindrotheca closterium]|uniref:Uncharacterized protein n=1 Tax=Cylindrotheca closterium TaxID=2856 RepID=A0AAD2PVN7_9STRA|nr:unnamed protein product [Cylindrotheca closterium]